MKRLIILATFIAVLVPTAANAATCSEGGETGFVIYDGTCVTPSVYNAWYPDAGLDDPINDPATPPSERILGRDMVPGGHRFIDLVNAGVAL